MQMYSTIGATLRLTVELDQPASAFGFPLALQDHHTRFGKGIINCKSGAYHDWCSWFVLLKFRNCLPTERFRCSSEIRIYFPPKSTRAPLLMRSSLDYDHIFGEGL